MAGRVHGRVAGGRVFILSDRDIHFASLRPTAPEFQLAGDSERVALTCADLGVRADDLDLPVPLDRTAYRNALDLLEPRGIVDHGRLTHYGRAVEALPVDRAWAELIVHAEDELLPFLAVMSSIDSLHRMTRDDRDLDGLLVPGSDHLTAYNLYAEAFATRLRGRGVRAGAPSVRRARRIEPWAERRGVLVKSVEDAALAMASVYRGVGLPLPTSMPRAGDRLPALPATCWRSHAVRPRDRRGDGWGDSARVSKTSVCGSWGAVAGTLRYFADRFGVPRAAIEGTQIPLDLIRSTPSRRVGAGLRRAPQAASAGADHAATIGFELEREKEPVDEPSGGAAAPGAACAGRGAGARRVAPPAAHATGRRSRRCARSGVARAA